MSLFLSGRVAKSLFSSMYSWISNVHHRRSTGGGGTFEGVSVVHDAVHRHLSAGLRWINVGRVFRTWRNTCGVQLPLIEAIFRVTSSKVDRQDGFRVLWFALRRQFPYDFRRFHERVTKIKREESYIIRCRSELWCRFFFIYVLEYPADFYDTISGAAYDWWLNY